MREKAVEIDGHVIQLSNGEKIYYPDEGITKEDVHTYYRRIAPWMLPHLKDRALSLQRFPEGIHNVNFYQKEVPDYFPDWIETVDIEVREEKTHQPQVVCQNEATLVYLVNQAALVFHTWLSRINKLDYPDKLIFDLDPPGAHVEPVKQAAWVCKDRLEELGLRPYLMTSGSDGYHVVVPLDQTADFDTVRDFARELAEELVQQNPSAFTTQVRKNKREGKVFLDYLRNAYAQTSVAPYSLRAKPGAPIATPLDWEELKNPDIHSQSYHLKNIFRRLAQKTDPWQGFFENSGSVTKAIRALQPQKNK